MRIGIDCKPLQRGPAGVQTYLRNLLPEMASIPETEVACFFSMAFEAPELPAGVKRIPVKGPWINNWVWMEWQLPSAVRKAAGGCRVPGVGGRGLWMESCEQGPKEGRQAPAADTPAVNFKRSTP